MRTAGYIRVSSDEQEREGVSLDAQVDAILRTEPGAAVYRDVMSGARADRPAYVQLLADAAAGKVDRVVVWKFDRLGRDAEELLRARRMLAAAGVEIVSLTEGKADSLVYGIRAIMGQHEREAIAERTRLGLRQVAREGRWTGGQPPLGYALSEGERGTRYLVVNETEAPVVRLAFRLYSEGRGANTITATLNREGYRTRRGAKFCPRVVVDMLRNRTYLGELVRNGETLCTGSHEAIVETDLWESVERLRRAKADQPGKGAGRPPKLHMAYPLLVCPNGHRMLPRRNTNGWEHYRCSNRHSGGDCPMPAVGRKKVDEALLRFFLDLAFDEEATRLQLRRASSAAIEESEALVQEADRQEMTARATLVKLDDEYLQMDVSQFVRLDKKFSEELLAATNQAERARGQLVTARAQALRLDTDAEIVDRVARAREAARGAVERASEADVAAVRAALQQLFVRIVVEPLYIDREWTGYDESDLPDGAAMMITPRPKQLMLIPFPREELLLESGLTERIPLDLGNTPDGSGFARGSRPPS